MTWLISLVCHQCQRGRLLTSDWKKLICFLRKKIVEWVSIIVLSLKSNLLSVGKTIAYMIQVLSLSWLMKKIWKGFNQQDVTRVPRGKVELWLCNGVQESVKTMITQCIDNLLKATLRKNRQTKPSKKIVGVEKMWSLIEVEQVNGSWVTEKYSWCRVIVCAKWLKS